tara:strand:- start:1649 stop:2158 length:510 start_codon:yes stop_codon:yes gene_type:complete
MSKVDGLLREISEKVNKLEMELMTAKEKLRETEEAWTLHRGESEDIESLPIPRLEMEWYPSEDGTWEKYTVEYRMVMKHMLGHVAIIPLGSTKIEGPPGSPWDRPNAEQEGIPRLPFRDGVHIKWDAGHLNLPAFAVDPSGKRFAINVRPLRKEGDVCTYSNGRKARRL